METTNAKYTLISDHNLQKIIQENYGTGPFNCLLFMNEHSEVYMLETQSCKYILKIYWAMHTNPEEIRAEVELMNCLHAGGVSVSYPIRNSIGVDIIFLKAKWISFWCTLFLCGRAGILLHE